MLTLRRTLIACLPIFWSLLLIACGGGSQTTLPSPSTTATPAAQTAFPVTVTDGLGRTVRIEKAPVRIVSYLPSNTETLFALGAGDRIVATDDFSDFPEAAKSKPKVGGLQLNLEALLAQQPDLVVSMGRTPDFPTLLAPHNIPVVVLEFRDIQGTLANMELLGKVLGREAEASRLVADLKSRLGTLQATMRSVPKTRVYYELDGTDPNRPFTVGSGTYTNDLLTAGGATNIAAGAAGGAPQLSVEEIVRANPELIIVPVGARSAPTAASVERFAQRPGWGEIDAVKHGKVRGVDSNLASRAGPRLAEGAEAMARAVHPDLFR